MHRCSLATRARSCRAFSQQKRRNCVAYVTHAELLAFMYWLVRCKRCLLSCTGRLLCVCVCVSLLGCTGRSSFLSEQALYLLETI